MEERKRAWPGAGGDGKDDTADGRSSSSLKRIKAEGRDSDSPASSSSSSDDDDGDRKMPAVLAARATVTNGAGPVTDGAKKKGPFSKEDHQRKAGGSSSSDSGDEDDDEEEDDDADESDGPKVAVAVGAAATGKGNGVGNGGVGGIGGVAAAAAAVSASGGESEESAKKRMRTAEANATSATTNTTTTTATTTPSASATTSSSIATAVGQNRVSHEDRWVEMFQRLLVYKEQNGNCRVPNRYPEDSQLGFWVSAQRRQYKIAVSSSDGSSALTPDRAKKLEEIGFEWSTSNPHHTPWETRYEELVDFVQKYGHAEVPMRWKENPKLSHWVSKQRHDFKLRKQGKSSRLNNNKLKLLNDCGFLWEGSRRSLKEKISIGGSEDSLTAGDESGAEVSPAVASSDVNALGQAANAVAALQAAMNTATNPAGLAAAMQGNHATAAAAATAMPGAQQGSLQADNTAQVLQALATAQRAQSMFAMPNFAAPATNPFLNLATAANPGHSQMNVDPSNMGAVLNLVGQLLAPLLVQQQQPTHQQLQMQLPMQQLLLQAIAPQLQQQQQSYPLLQLAQQQQAPQVHHQMANMAGLGNQQAIATAIQQALAAGGGGGQQGLPFMLGNQQGMAASSTGAPAASANDVMANQLRILQMAGLGSIATAYPQGGAAGGLPSPDGAGPPAPPGSGAQGQPRPPQQQPPPDPPNSKS